MESQSNGSVCEEETTSSKANPLTENQNSCDRNVNDVMVVYEYETEDMNDEYDLAMDGLLLNSCFKYLFKFSIIVLPIVFLLVIIIGVFESDSQNKDLSCKIGRAFIVLGISVGLLALYFLCRYVFHITSLYRENTRREDEERQNQSLETALKTSKLSKKQLKYILQNPWHRVSESEPKQLYSNRVNIYRQNGLYSSDDIV